jgi:hypothetical protein
MRRKISTRSSSESGLGKASAFPTRAGHHATTLWAAAFACQPDSFFTAEMLKAPDRARAEMLLQVIKARMAVTVHRSTHTPKSPIPHLMYLYLS